MGESDKEKQAFTDLAGYTVVHPYARARDALQDEAHRFVSLPRSAAHSTVTDLARLRG